jgi:hypothetical protein
MLVEITCLQCNEIVEIILNIVLFLIIETIIQFDINHSEFVTIIH